MEKYNVENHLFYDGYDLDNQLLGNPNFVNNILEYVNSTIFSNKGQITLVPYFNGKYKNDGGVSGIIIGDNFHFTCHTFSFKNTVFVDYYGKDGMKNEVENILLKYFDTKNYDMGSKDIKGNFGKHLILNVTPLSMEDSIKMVNTIVKEIDMTPINDILVYEKDDSNFDIVQLIAESHVAIHRTNDIMAVDVFSCKYFDANKVTMLFDSIIDSTLVNRGLKYIK